MFEKKSLRKIFGPKKNKVDSWYRVMNLVVSLYTQVTYAVRVVKSDCSGPDILV
jgi:hypothetical protein